MKDNDEDIGEDNVSYVKPGDRVTIVHIGEYGNAANERKQFVGRTGTILDEGRIGPEAGWDVYDIKLDDGTETFAHGFELDVSK